ncbi:MAG: type III-A CRISPR-associated RAMP protein Csm4, partial [Defluviitaleaceae bacterium]|nr:type III-A CRISPR-associated RAMP protein Csm4 [Defluviitaleaceae bacterium]
GGFVFSETYSEEALRKNDLFALDSGSVVRSRFKGGVYDVSHHGSHPVYRYAKPMLLGVKL